jgi:pimeloyl-ACP methyl ester carboxylesterase
MRLACRSIVAAAVVVAAGCGGGGGDRTRHTAGGRATPHPRPAPDPRPALADRAPCRDAPGMTCATLTVALDPSHRVPGTLRLRVAMSSGPAPRGPIVFLSGGPGQPAVPFAARVQSRFGPALRGYRLVFFDQRGTGAGALECPALQRELGSRDLTVPARSAVRDCARRLGARARLFTTTQTVADLEALRAALGADRLTLDGVSYGTLVAERYALAHPTRVRRLVLDSVVPHDGADLLTQRANMRATARVLRLACRSLRCPTDPVADLAAVVRARHNGPELLDAITVLSVAEPDQRPMLAALRQAGGGRTARLRQLLAGIRRASAVPASVLSQGLHAATLCGDTAVDRIRPRAVAPFDRETAAANGLIATCRDWPRAPAPAVPRDLPRVPTLLLAGDRDLSTPLEWAQQEHARAPLGRLVVVRGAGHSVQARATSDAGRRAVARFLAGG